MDERIKTLAYNLVNYSVRVQEGEKVYIHYNGKDTTELARQLVKEVYAAKGLPFVHFTDNRLLREQLLHCSEEQLRLMAEADCLEMNRMDCLSESGAEIIFPNYQTYPEIKCICMKHCIPLRFTAISGWQRRNGWYCGIPMRQWRS